MLFRKLKGIIFVVGQNDSLLKKNCFKEMQFYFRTFEQVFFNKLFWKKRFIFANEL